MRRILSAIIILAVLAACTPPALRVDVVDSAWNRVDVPGSKAIGDTTTTTIPDGTPEEVAAYVAEYNATHTDDQLTVYPEGEVPPVELAPEAEIWIANKASLDVYYHGVVARKDLRERREAYRATIEAMADPKTLVLVPCKLYVDKLPETPEVDTSIPNLWVALINWTTETVYYSEKFATQDEAIFRVQKQLAPQAELNNLGLGDMGEGKWTAYIGPTEFAFPAPLPVDPPPSTP